MRIRGRMIRNIVSSVLALVMLAACADDARITTRGSSDKREKVGVRLGLPF